jgi:N-carbamoyl-L-amino-acid hydrolase
MPEIDPARLMKDLRDLRAIGAYKTGVHRPTFSAEDIESRHWFAARMAEAGLEASIDGIGNVLGRCRAPGRKLLLGSHLETQNRAGWLDGALGVVYGLEVARALGRGIDVAAFVDEEGHYGQFIGSRSFCGQVSEAEMDRLSNRNTGESLRDSLARAGWAGLPRAEVDPARHIGYVEAHIEQGAELEDKSLRIGVVTAIVGSRRFRVVAEGSQNHAGTTRMAVRRDAGVALARLQVAIEDLFPRIAGPRTVWTMGRVLLDPGQPSIVPVGAEGLFQIRDTELATLDRMERALEDLVAAANARGPCRIALRDRSTTTPAAMDAGLRAALGAAAQARAPGLAQDMPSGAGHDAQVLSSRVPSAMLFVPSIGGISHHWSEDTSEADIVLGCRVLADAAAAVLAGVG